MGWCNRSEGGIDVVATKVVEESSPAEGRLEGECRVGECFVGRVLGGRDCSGMMGRILGL